MAPLSAERVAELEAAFERTDDAETRLRYQMVLLAQQGKTAREIAPLTLRSHETVLRVLHRYERGGAAAVSVLTEPFHFGGSLDDLRAARDATHLPVLRKDFIVDAYQLVESAAAGADAILLIVAALEPEALLDLHREARALDLDVLVEVHDEEELQAALEVEAEVIGINNRNLGDFSVDIERTYELLSDVPAGKTVVSESGFSVRDELDELDRVGIDAVLIGETLMRAPDIEAACRELTGGGDPAL
jgi:indole-3-glycerol phosphate synthase